MIPTIFLGRAAGPALLALLSGCGGTVPAPKEAVPRRSGAIEIPADEARPAASPGATREVSAPKDGIPRPGPGAPPSGVAAVAPDPVDPAREKGKGPRPEAAEKLSDWLKQVAGDPERALRELRASEEEARRDPALALLRGAVEAYLLSALGEDALAYAALQGFERRLRPFAPVLIRNACLTDGRDAGYGNPARRAEGPFAPVAMLNVYYEVDPICQKPDGDGFTAAIDVDLGIEDAAGKRLEEFEAWERKYRLRDATLRSGRYVTDFYFHYKGLPMPRLAKGDYRLVIRFRDMADPERRSVRSEIPFTVGG